MAAGDGAHRVQVLQLAAALEVKGEAGTDGGEGDDGEGRVSEPAVDEYHARGMLEGAAAAVVVTVVQDRGQHVADEQEIAVVVPAERVAEDLLLPLAEIVGVLAVRKGSDANANGVDVAGRLLLRGDLHATVVQVVVGLQRTVEQVLEVEGGGDVDANRLLRLSAGSDVEKRDISVVSHGGRGELVKKGDILLSLGRVELKTPSDRTPVCTGILRH